MPKSITVAIGGAVAVIMVIAALWCWQDALRLSATATRPEIAIWSVRSAAAALGALAQVVLMTLVVNRIFRRGLGGEILRLGAGVICGIAMVSAVALALAGR
jgi:hypothetical protein